MTPKTLAITLFTTLALTGSALAANGETPLGNCYNMVISSCNATSAHPTACANNGMDQCDDQYGNQVGGTPLGLSSAKPKRKALLLPAVQAAR